MCQVAGGRKQEAGKSARSASCLLPPASSVRHAPPGRSDASGASAEADRHSSVIDDHGNLAASGKPNHPLELFLVVFDVDVPNRVMPLRVVLTGRARVGSGVLSEYLDALVRHRASSERKMIRRGAWAVCARSTGAGKPSPDAMIFAKESWEKAAPPCSWPSSSRRPPPAVRSRAKSSSSRTAKSCPTPPTWWSGSMERANRARRRRHRRPPNPEK